MFPVKVHFNATAQRHFRKLCASNLMTTFWGSLLFQYYCALGPQSQVIKTWSDEFGIDEL